jgi:hypothetical protein
MSLGSIMLGLLRDLRAHKLRAVLTVTATHHTMAWSCFEGSVP